MTPTKAVDPEKIHIVSIKTIKGNIDGGTDASPMTVAGHHFDFELLTGIGRAEQMVGLQILADIMCVDASDQPTGIKGSYTHEVIFKVEDFEDHIHNSGEDTENFQVNEALMLTLAGIAYSTIRGIIFNRTQGTSLGTVILPVIAPKKLMGIE